VRYYVNMEKLSVILPLYNKESTILPCLESLRSQTYGDFEVIVVDDGSSDGSVDCVEEFLATEKDPRFTLIRNGHVGVSSTVNSGLARAKGDYVTRVDADDLVDPAFFATAFSLLEATGSSNDVHVRCRIARVKANFRLPERGETDSDRNSSPQNDTAAEAFEKQAVAVTKGGMCYRQLFGETDTSLMSMCGALYPRATLIEHGLTLDGRLANTEDILFNACFFALDTPVILLDEPLYYYRQTQNSQSRAYNPDLYRAADILYESIMGLESAESTRIVAGAYKTQALSYMSTYFTIVLLNEAQTPGSRETFKTRIVSIMDESHARKVFERARELKVQSTLTRILYSLIMREEFSQAELLAKTIDVARAIRRRLKTN